MKISKDAPVMDIIRDHEDRITAIELGIQWLPRIILLVTCGTQIARALRKQRDNLSKDI